MKEKERKEVVMLTPICTTACRALCTASAVCVSRRTAKSPPASPWRAFIIPAVAGGVKADTDATVGAATTVKHKDRTGFLGAARCQLAFGPREKRDMPEKGSIDNDRRQVRR